MKEDRKKELIETTYQLLQTTSIDSLTARDIAAAAGCNTAIIYRNFQNLDELICISCVKFLEAYLIDTQIVIAQTNDPMELELKTWTSFAKYAFQNVDVFERLFFGEYQKNLNDYIFSYYQLFPQNWKNLNGFFTTLFFNSNLKERNTLILTQAANAGYFKYEDVPIIANLQCTFLHGMLLDYQKTYRTPGVPEEAARIFIDTLKSIEEHYRIK